MENLYDYKKFAVLYVDDEEKSLTNFTRAFSDGFRILVRDSHPASGSGTFASLISDIASQVEYILADVLKERGISPDRLRLSAICTVCTKPFLKEIAEMNDLLARESEGVVA